MIKPIALTHICANYTYNHVLYDVLRKQIV